MQLAVLDGDVEERMGGVRLSKELIAGGGGQGRAWCCHGLDAVHWLSLEEYRQRWGSNHVKEYSAKVLLAVHESRSMKPAH